MAYKSIQPKRIGCLSFIAFFSSTGYKDKKEIRERQRGKDCLKRERRTALEPTRASKVERCHGYSRFIACFIYVKSNTIIYTILDLN